ncbi:MULTISPECIES: acyl-CoA dehydrogenase family protein [Cupriavidus]|jgi:putative acyl-CoA dehydrogenase|uniref:DNA alkylation response protein n=1 Tax=Cupriavidus metallidurans TaxID=119219 RepID=A0A482J4T6_9BURK|nr:MULTISPECIES: acyl-CoA dehydrogenase family protein [Cupriavidus]KWR80927.1 DNA alkylation response protein [Cupriavidus sp. SHE]QBP14034.1 DNA alkylation response protein [Cupriavidus metallidurans]QWC91814.1 acyl-CoA dehydrogenase family protein [Cupriavidus metallidurans]
MEWSTHEVTNVVTELQDYNVYTTDLPLQEAVRRAGAGAHETELATYGARLGSAETIRMAEEANHFKPELHTFDRQGRRIDRVEFHPSWHGIMRMAREQNLVAQPFADPRPGAWAAYAAGFSMHGQIEAGSQCPNSMTFACIPVLQREPELFAALAPKLYSRTYDARDIPLEQKDSILVGMGMTEKQGGSDVRANTTRAEPLRGEGRGGEYLITGHKWFFSAPMCDAHLVVARTESGPACFYVPRYRPDGTKNAVQIQRLKDKVGNRSNSSSEVEFRGAWGRMIGEEGRGIPTIIEMATFTRLNCVMGSTGLIRQCLVQALHHTRHRSAFGKTLIDQPLMRNVLADMALESEAATLMMMRLTEAFALADDDPLQRAYKRIVTPAAKFWLAKRSVELSGEAMEVFGGNGYMDEGPMGRLYRETPVISIWEGSGNVMALDMMRAISREPQAMQALLEDLAPFCRQDARLSDAATALVAGLRTQGEATEWLARRHAQLLVLLVQARLLGEHAPAAVADAFIASRFDAQWGRVFGMLPDGVAHAAILDRAWTQ